MSLRYIKLTVGSTPIGKAVTWSYPNHDGNFYVIPTYDMHVSGTNDSGRVSTKIFEVIRFGVHRRSTNSNVTVVGLADPQTHTIGKWIGSYKVHSYQSKEDGAWQVYGNYLIHDGPDNPMAEAYATAGCIEVCGGPKGFVIFNDFIVSLSGTKKAARTDKLSEIGGSGKMSIHYLAASRPPLQKRSP